MKLAFLQSHRLKTIVGGSVLFSLTVGFLCTSLIHTLPIHASMDMGAHSHTVHATSLSNCCDFGTSDHMELWKNTFVGTLQNLQELMTLVAVTLFITLTLADFFPSSRINENQFLLRFRQYAREHPNISLYNPLRMAFARGTLHPKTF